MLAAPRGRSKDEGEHACDPPAIHAWNSGSLRQRGAGSGRLAGASYDVAGQGWSRLAAQRRPPASTTSIARAGFGARLALAVVEGAGSGPRLRRAVEDPAQPVSEETVFEAASLGKPVFAYAVLRLVDAGVLDLDRPLYDYLPIPEANKPRMKRVTPRQVLSHTTGLPNWRQQPSPWNPRPSRGREFSYSGRGLLLSPAGGGGLSGKPFARLMREQVLDPLGMKQSSYVWLPEFESRMAAGYDGQENRLDVQAAIGRRTLAIARRVGESTRRVALRGFGPGGPAGQSSVAGAAAVHGAQRGDLAAHDRERLRQVPDPRGCPPTARPAGAQSPAGPAGDGHAASAAEQRPLVGTGLGNPAGRARRGALALGRQQLLPQLRHCGPGQTAGRSWCSPTARTVPGSTSGSSWR